MALNGYHAQPHERSPVYQYDGYDGSDYGSRPVSHAWGRSHAVTGEAVGSAYDGFDFGTSHVLDQPEENTRDSVTQHLLYETALLDSAAFHILDVQEVDALKQEQARLSSRVQATQHKLALETKVKDAAQNLHRLYALQRSRPDTPQRYDGREKRRSNRSSNSTDYLLQAQAELAESLRIVDDLNETIKNLLERRADVDRKLLSHTAAVLAAEVNNRAHSADRGTANGYHDPDEPDEFDDLRDILHGAPPESVGKAKHYEQEMSGVQARLEQLNAAMRGVIGEASRTLGRNVAPETIPDDTGDAATRINGRFHRLEDNLDTLRQQQEEMREHCARIQDSELHSRNSVEFKMEDLNRQLHNTLIQASEGAGTSSVELSDPPTVGGNGYTQQIVYMQELIQQHSHVLQSAREAGEHSSNAQQKLTTYEDVMVGLWDILQSDAPSATDADKSESVSATEPFSVQAFSSRVQHLFDRVSSANQQHDILRRQIQQQRELNGQSDAEKDRRIDELQTSHGQLTAERDEVQEELAKYMVQHEQAESEAGQLRSEQANVMSELDELRRIIETRQQERDEHSQHREQLETKLADVQGDMAGLESEVIRLTTELTMAKADLDVAHGSRAERADAAKAVEHTAQLERELQEMTTEFQAMTKESIELEKEREQLDGVVDELRDRIDGLEAALSDEKARWMGMKGGSGVDGSPRESMSMSVLRQEFKKMVRETRTEGVRLIRAEQEERRRLEAEVRKLRQANGPMGRRQIQTSESASSLNAIVASAPAS